jgi:hypothetical protein
MKGERCSPFLLPGATRGRAPLAIGPVASFAHGGDPRITVAPALLLTAGFGVFPWIKNNLIIDMISA